MIDDIRPRVNRATTELSNRTYYYVWGKTKLGRNYIDGPYNTEDNAWQGGYQALDGDFKIVPLRTRDLATATRVIKRMDLNETRSLDESLRRARHQLGGNHNGNPSGL